MKYNKIAVFLLFLFGLTYAQKATFYLYSELGCVDTVRMKISQFDWARFPDHEIAFVEADSKSDEWAYLVKYIDRDSRFDGILCKYKRDWRELVSQDSLRIKLGHSDTVELQFIAANMLFTETNDDSLPYRFYKPDMLTLIERRDYHYLNSQSKHPVLAFTENHYPSVSWLSFDEEPQKLSLEPIEFAYAMTSFQDYNIERFHIIRKKPMRRRWRSDDVWCKVPMLSDSAYNVFSVRKFGFWRKEISLNANEQKSIVMNRWLYFNPCMVWVWESERLNGPWPADIIMGLDVSSFFPGKEKSTNIGIDYGVVLSPFPTAIKAQLEWFYADLANIELYYLSVFDSNPFRYAGHGFITEAELSGKILLGQSAWRFFPFLMRGGYGIGRTFHPSIYRMRFLSNTDARYAQGVGGYISAGFELWFLRSALIRPTIETGIAFGSGSIISVDGRTLSESDSNDERIFPFLRLNFRP